MKTRIVLPFFITTFLFLGYPTFKAVQANQATLIAQQSIWKPFSSKEGGFKILMPGTPTLDKRNINSRGVSIPFNGFYVNRQDEAFYGVAYMELPRNTTLNSSEVNQLLSRVVSSFSEGAKGRLVSQRNIRLGNFPGKEFRSQLDQGAIAKGRTYWVNKRLYLVVVATNKETSLTKSINGFFNSFQLLNTSTTSRRPSQRTSQRPSQKPSQEAQKPSLEQLNTNLKQAVCGQNWSQAVKVIDQMLNSGPSPEIREQLVTYRSQLQGLASSNSKVPPESLPGCTVNK